MYPLLLLNRTRVCLSCVSRLNSLRINSFHSEFQLLRLEKIHLNFASSRFSSACQINVDSKEIRNRNSVDTEIASSKSDCDVNRFADRTHSCGQVSDSLVDQQVTLCGWLEYERLGKFIVLRDCYGSTQLFIKNKNQQNVVKKLYKESVIQVKGQVCLRPEKDINHQMKNGNVEVVVHELTVLNEAKENMPILPREYENVTEKTRLDYRYIDLRHPRMTRNLRVRSNFIMSLRNHLVNQFGFVEVETPTLFKATPGVWFTCAIYVLCNCHIFCILSGSPRIYSTYQISESILQFSAKSAAIQTTSHGRRHRPIFSSCPVLPR